MREYTKEDRSKSLLINGPPGAQLKELPTIHCHTRSKSKDAFPQRPRSQQGPRFAWRGLVFSRMAAHPQRATVPGSKAVRSYFQLTGVLTSWLHCLQETT